MASYEKGDSGDFGDEIERIQRKLGIETDGDFGPQTQAAVKAWQKANGHKADGRVGPDMLLELGLTELIILEKWDTGDLVGRVQSMLGLKVDREYGGTTVRAVRDWQKAKGLKASGSADYKTLKAMGVLVVTAPVSAGVPVASPARRETSVPTSGSRPVHTDSTPAAIRSWAYQLTDIKPKEIAALGVDLVVIDYAAEGDEESAFTPTDVARMKRRPGGGTKKLVCYMSIGEAEDYRFYWQSAWNKKATRPQWLDDENPDWQGNYKVRFWDEDWQAIILGKPTAYLDRIIAAGFDGVYLDIIDAFEYWRDEKRERSDADREMIAFVQRISAHARAKRPDFMIIAQNGEALLADPGYRGAISAQAKEDIFYGIDGDGKANTRADVEHAIGYLAYARDAGLPILAVEYLDDDRKIAEAAAKLADLGCIAYFGPRDLDELNTAGLA